MYISTNQTTTDPITADVNPATARHAAEVHVSLGNRAALFLTPGEAAELISVLTVAVAELSAQTLVGV